MNVTIQESVWAILRAIGEDPDRDGLAGTPERVARAIVEMTSGYDADIESILSAQFDDRCDEMVVLRGVRFASLCEHHVLPFSGSATVGYIPGKKVVGLSKMARLVDAYARRLQVQERLTTEIAEALQEHLDPIGVGVVIKARHSCMGVRGAMQPDAEMVTSAMLGAMKDEASARAEFLSIGGVA